ncbi:MAG: glycosyltransferase family 2 protein [Nostoc sp.]|uniref:glycosyltransferase family 2 protein n=1 Tax=Nostoc sp. TaxID=1180 RepID=UPI002FF4C6C3
MKFYALLPVRDEADIIKQCLEHLLQWVDAVYVFDTGSVDNTWEIVLDVASQDKRVKPIRKEPVYFSENKLRGYMFHIAREQMRDGDWFLRVDADEFHHIPPPEFVKTYLRLHETIVYHQYYDFQLTEAEVAAWERGEETINDRQRPIEERRRYFIPSYYSEPRLCRYRSTMKWPETCSFPINAGFMARERLPIRHYPHRDLVQLIRRNQLRAIMVADSTNRKNWSEELVRRWSEVDWRKFVVNNDNPELQHWELGKDLPRYQFTTHLKPPHIRYVQRLVHASLLPILDLTRPAFSDNTQPQPISEEINQLLIKVLSNLS